MDTMIFNLTRDSVSMGDDVNAPHTEILTFQIMKFPNRAFVKFV